MPTENALFPPPLPRRPPFSDIRLIVFDLDGTLLDTFEDIAAAANHALKSVGRAPLAPATIKGFVGGGARFLVQKCLGGAPDEETLDRAFAAWQEYYHDHPADFAKPYPGVMEILEELRRRGLRIAVLSNKLHTVAVQTLRQTGLEPLLDAICGEKPPVPRKPDPAELFRLMEEFEASVSRTLIVGDGPADMEVSRNSGVAAVGVSWGVSDAAHLRDLGASVVIDSFSDLLNLLDS